MKHKKYILAMAGALSLLQSITGYAGTWLQEAGNWVYLKDDGNYAEYEWIQDKGDWYYCSRWGKMETNTVIDGYYIGADGRMLSSDDAENPLHGERVCGTCYMQVNDYKDCGAYYEAKATLYDSSYYTNDELNYVRGEKIWIEHRNAYGTVSSVSFSTSGDVTIEAKCGKDTYYFSKESAVYCPYQDEEQVLKRKIKEADVVIPKDVTVIPTTEYLKENTSSITTLETLLNHKEINLIPVFNGNRVSVFYEDECNYAS